MSGKYCGSTDGHRCIWSLCHEGNDSALLWHCWSRFKEWNSWERTTNEENWSKQKHTKVSRLKLQTLQNNKNWSMWKLVSLVDNKIALLTRNKLFQNEKPWLWPSQHCVHCWQPSETRVAFLSREDEKRQESLSSGLYLLPVDRHEPPLTCSHHHFQIRYKMLTGGS